jgi:hypothetical protein
MVTFKSRNVRANSPSDARAYGENRLQNHWISGLCLSSGILKSRHSCECSSEVLCASVLVQSFCASVLVQCFVRVF